MVDQIKEESGEVVKSALTIKPTICPDEWNVAMREREVSRMTLKYFT